MGRRPRRQRLRVYLNARLVGYLGKQAGGAIEFAYHQDWLDWTHAIPVSLSLPLREDAYRGAPVAAVFENLLPDSEGLRRRVAERMGADGIDAYSLLAQIGRDCVGALQFVGESEPAPEPNAPIDGAALGEAEIDVLLNNLALAPLGLAREEEFRISVAGAQEKTALLRYEGRWLKPHGTTPTTHILKPGIGRLPNGIDLTDSVENEYFCLKLIEAFGLPVNHAEIRSFGRTKALVIERFDRRWTKNGRLLRLPQEDCCQALSVPPMRKYQNEGGPGIVQVLKLLGGSDEPYQDQKMFLMAQMVFWLIGATDGHAKNFSLYLAPGGRFRLTPLYDVLTAQPSLDGGQIRHRQMTMAMSVGKSRHYRFDTIHGRHFVETALEAGLPRSAIDEAFSQVRARAEAALEKAVRDLPAGFPEEIPASVKAAVESRLKAFRTAAADAAK